MQTPKLGTLVVVRKTAPWDSSLETGSTTPSRDGNKEGTQPPFRRGRGPHGSKKTKASPLVLNQQRRAGVAKRFHISLVVCLTSFINTVSVTT